MLKFVPWASCKARGFFLIMKKILFLPLLFFFALSCNKDSRQDWTGMEYFTFKIEGRVTDASGQALSGIRVEALGQQTATRSDGTYKIEGTGYKLYLSFSLRLTVNTTISLFFRIGQLKYVG